MMTNSTIKVYDEALHLQVEEYMAAHRAFTGADGREAWPEAAPAINQYLSRKYRGQRGKS